MDWKKLAGTGLSIALVFAVVCWRMSVRTADDSAVVKAQALELVSFMEGYEKDKVMLDQWAERAHSSAFNTAYEAGRRRRHTTFDEDKYLDAFFRSMASQADMMNRPDLKVALAKLRALNEEEPSDEAESTGDGAPEEDVAGTANALTGADAPAESDVPTESEESADTPSARMLRADFDALPDDRLEDELLGRISQALESSSADDVAVVKELSRGQRMLYVTHWVHAEVTNGGFNQFFTNPSGRYTRMAVPAFKLIGAKKHPPILRRAIAAYARQNPRQKIFKVDKTVKGYLKKYKDKSLDKVDAAYRAVEEDLSALRVKYIREHPDEFVDP